nr:hypothetical protein [Tanacetum cinerariifolium]
MNDQLAELNNNVKIQHTTLSELEECLRKKDFENEHLKSKIADCTMCQKLQMQVTELKIVNESLNLTVEELYKARALAEATLREIGKMVFAQCEKIRLSEEQSEPFCVLKETGELVVRFLDDKYCALKEIESLKVEIKSLQTENQNLKSKESELNNLEKVYEIKESVLLKDIDHMRSHVSELLKKLKISDQEMKQQIILFEEDKRIFLAKNEFLEKVSFLVQKEYNDLLASNVVLKQRLATKFNFLKHDTSLEKMFEMIEKDYE